MMKTYFHPWGMNNKKKEKREKKETNKEAKKETEKEKNRWVNIKEYFFL